MLVLDFFSLFWFNDLLFTLLTCFVHSIYLLNYFCFDYKLLCIFFKKVIFVLIVVFYVIDFFVLLL